MAAEAAFEEGLTQRRVSGETVRATLSRLLGVRWMRAKRWITSPDPLTRKKRRRDRLMSVAAADPDAWAVGFCDECWWSRVALPTLRAGARKAFHFVSFNGRSPKTIPSRRPSPATDSTCTRSVTLGCASWMAGRQQYNTPFLEWSRREALEEIGKKVLLLIWDNASWHVSKEVRRWLYGKLSAPTAVSKRVGEGVTGSRQAAFCQNGVRFA